MVAKTEVQRPGKGGIKVPEVNMRTKSHLSSYEEVKTYGERSLMSASRDLSLRWKRKVQESIRIKFGM